MPIEFTAVELNHWGIRWVKVGATLRTLELVEAAQVALDPLPQSGEVIEEAAAPVEGEEAAGTGTDEDKEENEETEGEEAEAPEPVPASARPDDDGMAPWSEIERRQIATLRRLVAEGHIPHEFVITAIPGAAVTARLASFPFDKRAKIEQVLKTEVDSRLPYDIDDVITDFVMIGKLGAEPADEDDTTTAVLAFAAFKGAVGRTLRLFRAAGIELRQIDTQPVALAALPGSAIPDGPQLRVFLGERETTASVVDKGLPIFVRTVPMGFLHSVSKWEAPEEKREQYVRSLEDPSFQLPPEEPRPDLTAFLTRIRKDLTATARGFEAQYSATLSSVIWFGPGARDPHILERLSENFPVPAGAFTPDAESLGALAFPYDRPVELWSGVNAMALRLARPDKCPVGINLRREEFSYRSRFRDLGEKLLPATYFLVAVVLMYVISTMVEIRSLQEKLAESRIRVADAYRQSTGKDLADYSTATSGLQSELAVKERLLEVMSEISGVSILNHLAEISRTVKPEVTIDTDSLSVEKDRVILDARTADYNTLGLIEGYFTKHPFYRKSEVRNTRRLPDGKVGFRMELYMSSEEEQAKALEQQKKSGAASGTGTDAAGDQPGAGQPSGTGTGDASPEDQADKDVPADARTQPSLAPVPQPPAPQAPVEPPVPQGVPVTQPAAPPAPPVPPSRPMPPPPPQRPGGMAPGQPWNPRTPARGSR